MWNAERAADALRLGGELRAAGLRADVYPEPERFRPERFIEQQADTYSWIPFGGGIRRCLGASFATYELKVVIPAILRTVRLRAVSSEPEPIRRRAITFVPGRDGAVVVEGFRERAPRATGRERVTA